MIGGWKPIGQIAKLEALVSKIVTENETIEFKYW